MYMGVAMYAPSAALEAGQTRSCDMLPFNFCESLCAN